MQQVFGPGESGATWFRFSEKRVAIKRKRKTTTKRRKVARKTRNVPTNKKLYATVKAAAKRKFAVYPSVYANAWLVREYKKRGGKYRSG